MAVSLREFGNQDPVTLVGAEEHYPYQRPPLSKTFLAGDVDRDSLALRTSAFYQEHRIEVVRGECVENVELGVGDPVLGIATTSQGRSLAFDRLAITVGAMPRRLFVPGADFEGICYLRDIDDALQLRSRLADAKHVVVVGGGFIGLEAAAVMRSVGKSVVIVEAADRLLPRVVGQVISSFYQLAHLRHGVQVRLGAAAVAFLGANGRVRGVGLSDGTELLADLVLVGVGIVPRTELAEQMGLRCEGGVVVDNFARTSNPSVVAAGDCTVSSHPRMKGQKIRLESVQNAVSQARVAAGTLAGRPEPYTAVPWFWSDQYDLKLQIAGLVDDYDQAVVRGSPENGAFSVLYYRDAELLGINAVNSASDYMAVRIALSTKTNISMEQAADLTLPLKSAISGALPPCRYGFNTDGRLPGQYKLTHVRRGDTMVLCLVHH